MTAWTLLAATTADDVFKSMGDSSASGGGVAAGPVLAVIAVLVGLVILISMLNRRFGKGGPRPDTANSPSRLLKEVAREIGLRKKDVRELKKLAVLAGVDHPLTLLLCPSLMQAAIAKREAAGK